MTACVAESGDEGFNIVNNLTPGANCALTPGGAFLARGTIDIQSPNPYVLTPEFTSRISAGEGAAEFQRTIALRGANVEVKNAQTGATLGKFKSLFSASLSPLGKTTAAFDVVTPEILKASGATPTMRVQLVARVTAYGALGGSGDNIDAVPFEYPITVCDGCVANILGACPLPNGTEVGTSMPNGCNPFQDGVVQCCMGPSGPVCPPTTMAAPVALTVTKAGTMAAAITVTSVPSGISCGTDCTESYPVGESVVLTVAGSATYTWTVGTGTCAANTACTVTMNAAQNVTVTAP